MDEIADQMLAQYMADLREQLEQGRELSSGDHGSRGLCGIQMAHDSMIRLQTAERVRGIYLTARHCKPSDADRMLAAARSLHDLAKDGLVDLPTWASDLLGMQ